MVVKNKEEVSIKILDLAGNINDQMKDVLYDGLGLNKKAAILGDQPAWKLTSDTEKHEKKILELAYKMEKLTKLMGA